jgi:two-component system chemotaxis response regulator CheB
MNRGEVFKTYEALAAGAVDVLEKPAGPESAGEWERKFLAAVKLVSRIQPITHVRGRIGSIAQTRPAVRAVPPAQSSARTALQLVAIGASTGGPGAVLQVLRALPRDFPLPILLVLHINEPFAAAFAQWLDGQTGFRVSYALDNQPLSTVRGQVTLAPPGSHLEVRGKRMRLSSAPERHSCRPSIDVLFESLATVMGASTAACLLTGMGRDGAAGLLEIRRAGGLTIAQDEATSVVYGMPREAMLIGAAERILPLAEIGPWFAALVEASAVE